MIPPTKGAPTSPPRSEPCCQLPPRPADSEPHRAVLDLGTGARYPLGDRCESSPLEGPQRQAGHPAPAVPLGRPSSMDRSSIDGRFDMVDECFVEYHQVVALVVTPEVQRICCDDRAAQ